VTFQREKAEHGSAGHLTRHIIYTWKQGQGATRRVGRMNFDELILRQREVGAAARAMELASRRLRSVFSTEMPLTAAQLAWPGKRRREMNDEGMAA
jgi:hypothetical protein